MIGASEGADRAVPPGLDVRASSARLERLLAEIQSRVEPPAWQRVEDLVGCLVSLYGTGLSRMLAHASQEASLLEKWSGDEVVSNLLLLHGLHPLSLEERVRRALDKVRPYLGSHAGDVELLGFSEAGAARLRLLGTCQGCPSSRVTIEHAIRRALEEAAPDLDGVEVEGAAAAAEPAPVIVSGRLVPKARQPGTRSVELDGLDSLPAGGRRTLQAGELPVIVFRLASGPVAYENACPTCRARLDGGRLEAEGVLQCAGCARRFDLLRAGRALEENGAGLSPLPLLADERGARLAIPEPGP